MALYRFATLVAFLVLAGCSAKPELIAPEIKQDFVTVSQIMKSAQCGLTRAAKRNSARFAFNKANLILTLKVTEVRTSSGALELAVPIGSGSLSLVGNRNPDNTAIRQVDIKAQHNVGDGIACPEKNIAQGMGIWEWLNSMDAVFDGTIFPNEISQVITFKVGLNTDLSPKFTRTDADGGKRLVSGKFTDNRNLEHKLNITIKPRKPGGEKIRVNAELDKAATATAQRLSEN